MSSTVLYRDDGRDCASVTADGATAQRVGDRDRRVKPGGDRGGRGVGVAWHTAHTALVTATEQWLPTPPPTRVLGIDETRARRVRWLLEPAGWRRSDPVSLIEA
jgi:hypothetical protein